MRLKYLLLISFLLICSITLAQRENFRNINLYSDDSIVYRWTDSLLRNIATEIIVFQTIRPFDSIKSSDGFLTFLIWQQDKSCKTLIVSDSGLYSASLSNYKSIFNYQHKKKTFVSGKEQTLKFIPPILLGNAVYFFSRTIINYFDLAGNNEEPLTYEAFDKQKQLYRKNFFNLIYTTLNKQLTHLEAIGYYLRRSN